MNYFILLARLFLVAYSAFFLLFAFGEGITGDGLQHVLPPISIVLILIFLWNKFVWSAIATIILFALFLLGTRKDPNLEV